MYQILVFTNTNRLKKVKWDRKINKYVEGIFYFWTHHRDPDRVD